LESLGDNNIKINLKKMWCGDVDMIHVAQDRIQWQALVNTVMNVRFQVLKAAIMKMTDCLPSWLLSRVIWQNFTDISEVMNLRVP
jgi:hypothetical protein